MSRFIAYARISVDRVRTRSSLSHQVALCVEYGQRSTWRHVATVREAASGEGLAGRELCRALEMLEQREAEIIVVRRLDRLARSAKTFQAIFDRVYAVGARIAVVEHGATYADQNELARATLLEQRMAVYELELTRKRTSDGKLSAHQRGSMLQKARFGYKLKREWRNGIRVNVPVPEPSKAKTVRAIFNYYLSGIGSAQIARKLNQAGVRSPATSEIGWNPGQIHRILSWSYYYAGKPSVHICRIGGREQHVLIEYPAIVSINQAESVGRRLKERQRGSKRSGNPLRGLIHCSNCGGRGSLQGPSYVCASKHREYIYRSTGMAVNFRSCRHTLSKQHVLRRLRDYLVGEQQFNRDQQLAHAVAALDEQEFEQLHRLLEQLSVSVMVDFDEPSHSVRKNSLKMLVGG